MLKVGRPPKNAEEVLAYTGKRWIKDDGKPHVGFSYRDPPYGAPIALYFSESEKIQETVMHKTCDRFQCANGVNGLYYELFGGER